MAINPTGPLPGLRPGPLPLSPWVLVDDTTIEQTALLLERLVSWLATAAPSASSDCASALSLGEDDFPDTVATWADALAARLRHCGQGDVS
jgi:hypothetical protein